MKPVNEKTMSILDTDSSPWDAGTYQLTAYCMGSGTLNASFSIGEQYEDRTVSCTDDIAQETLTIRTEGGGCGRFLGDRTERFSYVQS